MQSFTLGVNCLKDAQQGIFIENRFTRRVQAKLWGPRFKLILDNSPKINTIVTFEFYVTIPAIVFEFDVFKCAASALAQQPAQAKSLIKEDTFFHPQRS